MADMRQLEAALRNADAAGDTDAARALAAEITRQRSAAPAAAPAPAKAEPTLSAWDKIGRGMMDPINGGAQLLTNILPEGVVNAGNKVNNWLADKTGLVGKLPAGGVDQQVREGNAQYEAQRAAQGESGFDGYRMLGNVVSPANLAMGAAVPRAATAAGRIGLGALAGAGGAALNPVTEGDFGTQKLDQIKTGAAFGAALPVATGLTSRTAKVLRAGLVDPFTEAGRTKIIGNTLNRAAANKAEAAGNMGMVTGATPGFLPTAGQASNDAGIASLERAARAIDPAGFGDIDSTQRAALVNALRGVAKTPEERAAAVTARETAVKPMYSQAKKAVVSSDDTIDELLQRPSMAAAAKRAGVLAAERGEQFAISPGAPARQVPSGLLDAQGNPIMSTAPAVPGQLQGTALHDLKMGLDDAIGSPGIGGMQGAERNAALGTKSEFMDWLEKQIPDYAQAKTAYAAASNPISQMDVGQELLNRFVPPLADGMGMPFSSRASSFANALRNGDKLVQNVTGMKGAKFDKIMAPEQVDALQGVLTDSQMKAFAESAGRGVGSDTVQKMAMSNMIDQAGLPSWVGALKPLGSVAGMARTVGDIVYSKNDESMRHLLADVLKDPKRAAEAMKKAGIAPSKFVEYLNRMGEVGTPAASAAIVAGEQ